MQMKWQTQVQGSNPGTSAQALGSGQRTSHDLLNHQPQYTCNKK